MYVSFSVFFSPPPHFQASSQGFWKSYLRDFCSIKSAKRVCLEEGDPHLETLLAHWTDFAGGPKAGGGERRVSVKTRKGSWGPQGSWVSSAGVPRLASATGLKGTLQGTHLLSNATMMLAQG